MLESSPRSQRLMEGLGFAQVTSAPGVPFQCLQNQINELKAEMKGIQGAIQVYDDNGQYLGILLGVEVYRPQISIPQINWPTLINLRDGNVYPGSPGARFKYESDDCSGPCYTDGDPVDALTISESTRSPFQYFVARSGRRTITAFSERDTIGACVRIPGGAVFNGHIILQVSEEEIPFELPVALPLHYGPN